MALHPVMMTIQLVNLSVAIVTTLFVGYVLWRGSRVQDWDVLTSRIFLNQDQFKLFLHRITVLLGVSGAAMIVVHTLQILQAGPSWLHGVFHGLSMLAVLVAAFLIVHNIRTLESPA